MKLGTQIKKFTQSFVVSIDHFHFINMSENLVMKFRTIAKDKSKSPEVSYTI